MPPLQGQCNLALSSTSSATQARVGALLRVTVLLLAVAGILPAGPDVSQLKVRITWGHQKAERSEYKVGVYAAGGASVDHVAPYALEAGESAKGNLWSTHAGAGDIDGISFTASWNPLLVVHRDRLQRIWSDLISASDPGTAGRLMNDPTFQQDPPRIIVKLDGSEVRGFTVALSQLIRERAIWIPSLGIYLSAGDEFISFEQHMQSLKTWQGQRLLDTLQREPEATYDQYAQRWQNMGSPAYINPAQMGPGHIIGISWDSAIPKFGIDRGSGVWSDYGNPDKMQFWFDFGDLNTHLADGWKGQRLEGGLPIVTTTIEKEEVGYQVEQFAYPLDGPPKERRGDISMVLMEKLRLTNLAAEPRQVILTLHQRRHFDNEQFPELRMEEQAGKKMFRQNGHGGVMFEVDGRCTAVAQPVLLQDDRDNRKDPLTDVFLRVELPAHGSETLIVKLPSPIVSNDEAERLAALQYDSAHAVTVRFWSDYLAEGAQFKVPDDAVNTLYRASLWHALRLPRRHGGQEKNVEIDLPFSNFAYDQKGTPWPVNQAVYVDYMLYDLRGYHALALEELLTQYRNNQEEDGRVGGLARWGVYTPSMLYSSAQYYLLSGNRSGFAQLLPQSLKALDWCLQQVTEHRKADGTVINGLLFSGLNDLTGEGEWAFNQAYMYAGLELFGQALQKYGDPRAKNTLETAAQVRLAVNKRFENASAESTVVELRDHTWIPYVPSNAETPRRLMDIWYPTDVDTGAVHLIRLNAIDAHAPLSDYLLNDHEDNLFYKGLGSANEPVYAQHANAYLLRDEIKPLIRAFYSLMASGFSQNVFEPVEHRWTWGQYFGSPCTDGAWFELYRNMLIHEGDGDSLELGLGVPRAWLLDGKKIEVSNAPTYFGAASFQITSHTASGNIQATLKLEQRAPIHRLVLRFRHPEGKQLRSVSINGKPWQQFDREKEWIIIPEPTASAYAVEANY